MDKISILFVIDGLEFGGGERTFLQLIEGLPQNQYNIHVATSPRGTFSDVLIKKGEKPIPINLMKRLSIGTLQRLIKIIKENNINIIHSQGARTDFCSRMATRLLKSKVGVVNTIAMPVEGYDVGLLRKKIYSFFDRFSERYVDYFIVISDALKKFLIDKHKIPPKKIFKIYNGIELNEYHPDNSDKSSMKIRKEFGIDKDEFLIAGIGRLVWQKGFEYLIKAASEVLKEYPSAKFLIVGEGPLKDSLREKCRKLDIEDKIIFAGFRSNIKEILTSIDILVMPSVREGFPMVTLEAMAMAKPIVATDINGIREQIDHDENGLLIPPEDPEAIADAIIFLFNNKEKSEQLGFAAKKKAEEKFSVEEMIKKTETVYEELLA